jgi:hypothetical protein
MGKKILIAIIIVLLIIITLGAGLYYLGAFEEGGLVKLIVGGEDVENNFFSEDEKKLVEECDEPECLFENFNEECKKSFGTVPIPEEEMLIYVEITGRDGNRCKMNAKLIDANGPAEFAKGLSATCYIAPEEVDTLQANFNLSDMDCKGPLYEAAKKVS